MRLFYCGMLNLGILNVVVNFLILDFNFKILLLLRILFFDCVLEFFLFRFVVICMVL